MPVLDFQKKKMKLRRGGNALRNNIKNCFLMLFCSKYSRAISKNYHKQLNVSVSKFSAPPPPQEIIYGKEFEVSYTYGLHVT
jgi:hypothetical protein